MTQTVTVTCPFCHQDHDVEIEVEDDFECGATLSDGGTCGRTVGSPSERCWDHE